MQTIFSILLGSLLFASIYWLQVQIDEYRAEQKDLKQQFKRKNHLK